MQAAAGFFTYFYIMHDYGFTPSGLFGLTQTKSYRPLDTDSYKPEEKFKGNSCADRENLPADNACDGRDEETFDMLTPQMSGLDVRLFFHELPVDTWSRCRWTPNDGAPHFWKYSHVSANQVCYTIEALYYAQCGYLVSIVVVQWSDLLICKTRNLSIAQQGMVNFNMNCALFSETALVAFLCYFKWINVALGTRMIAFPHFAVPSLSFFMVIIFYDETRKVFLRLGMVPSKTTGRIKFDGWVVRNTYY